MGGDKRFRLTEIRAQLHYRQFDSQIVPRTRFRALNECLWESLLNVEGTRNLRSGLENSRLLARDETGVYRATVASALLCTPSAQHWFPRVIIMAVHYRGLDQVSEQLDSQEIAGPLLVQIADSVRFLVRKMRIAARRKPARRMFRNTVRPLCSRRLLILSYAATISCRRVGSSCQCTRTA